MIDIQDSRLFFDLLHFQLYKDFSVKQIAFYIDGYYEKDRSGNITEPWIYEFKEFINLIVTKKFLNIDYRYPQGYYSIITQYQQSNEDGLNLFYEIFYEYCELHIPDFKLNLEKYLSRATKHLPSDS